MPPYVWIKGQLFIVANWTEELKQGDWLLLRPATPAENDNYYERVGDAEEEAYYTSMLVDEDRLSGR